MTTEEETRKEFKDLVDKILNESASIGMDAFSKAVEHMQSYSENPAGEEVPNYNFNELAKEYIIDKELTYNDEGTRSSEYKIMEDEWIRKKNEYNEQYNALDTRIEELERGLEEGSDRSDLDALVEEKRKLKEQEQAQQQAEIDAIIKKRKAAMRTTIDINSDLAGISYPRKDLEAKTGLLMNEIRAKQDEIRAGANVAAADAASQDPNKAAGPGEEAEQLGAAAGQEPNKPAGPGGAGEGELADAEEQEPNKLSTDEEVINRETATADEAVTAGEEKKKVTLEPENPTAWADAWKAKEKELQDKRQALLAENNGNAPDKDPKKAEYDKVDADFQAINPVVKHVTDWENANKELQELEKKKKEFDALPAAEKDGKRAEIEENDKAIVDKRAEMDGFKKKFEEESQKVPEELSKGLPKWGEKKPKDTGPGLRGEMEARDKDKPEDVGDVRDPLKRKKPKKPRKDNTPDSTAITWDWWEIIKELLDQLTKMLIDEIVNQKTFKDQMNIMKRDLKAIGKGLKVGGKIIKGTVLLPETIEKGLTKIAEKSALGKIIKAGISDKDFVEAQNNPEKMRELIQRAILLKAHTPRGIEREKLLEDEADKCAEAFNDINSLKKREKTLEKLTKNLEKIDDMLEENREDLEKVREAMKDMPSGPAKAKMLEEHNQIVSKIRALEKQKKKVTNLLNGDPKANEQTVRAEIAQENDNITKNNEQMEELREKNRDLSVDLDKAREKLLDATANFEKYKDREGEYKDKDRDREGEYKDRKELVDKAATELNNISDEISKNRDQISELRKNNKKSKKNIHKQYKKLGYKKYVNEIQSQNKISNELTNLKTRMQQFTATKDKQLAEIDKEIRVIEKTKMKEKSGILGLTSAKYKLRKSLLRREKKKIEKDYLKKYQKYSDRVANIENDLRDLQKSNTQMNEQGQQPERKEMLNNYDDYGKKHREDNQQEIAARDKKKATPPTGPSQQQQSTREPSEEEKKKKRSGPGQRQRGN